MKAFAFRFDIDTPTCLREGVPGLLDLSSRLGIRFSYFLSVGRSVSRIGALRRALGRGSGRAGRAAAYSARRKLGTVGYLRLALRNPPIGRGSPAIVRRIHDEAELALHGGRNHDTWQHEARSWSPEAVASEIDWALGWVRDQGLDVTGFCSPGWNAPELLPELLVERGFSYRTDRYGRDQPDFVVEHGGLLNLTTNILGEPGGVAYVEHVRARGLSSAEIRDDFRERLHTVGDHAVTYDHPYFAGVHALDTVEDLVRVALDEGYEVVTTRELADRRGARVDAEDGPPAADTT